MPKSAVKKKIKIRQCLIYAYLIHNPFSLSLYCKSNRATPLDTLLSGVSTLSKYSRHAVSCMIAFHLLYCLTRLVAHLRSYTPALATLPIDLTLGRTSALGIVSLVELLSLSQRCLSLLELCVLCVVNMRRYHRGAILILCLDL